MKRLLQQLDVEKQYASAHIYSRRNPYTMATESELAAFLDRQTLLLKRERDAEIERTSLLLSSCSPKLLERKGLALGALGVASVRIGLGGKRSARCAPMLLEIRS